MFKTEAKGSIALSSSALLNSNWERTCYVTTGKKTACLEFGTQLLIVNGQINNICLFNMFVHL